MSSWYPTMRHREPWEPDLRNDKTFPYEWEVQENCVYVLGDNRENSTDSRAFGQIQLDLVNGVVHQFIIDNKDEPLGKFYKYL